MRTFAVVCALVFPLLPVVALAQTPKPEEVSCLGVVSAGEESKPRLMKVVGNAPRVHFIENLSTKKPSCPADTEACRRKGFVVPGDTVLAGVTARGLTCVSYIAPNVRRVKDEFPETSGFLPASALVEQPQAALTLDDWFGSWARSAEGEVDIMRAPDGKLKILGSATFGAKDPRRAKAGAVNMGELDGEALPKGNMIALGAGYDGTKPFGDDRSECRAKLRLFGRYLVVEDNMACGGMNVSFTGIYVQLK